MLSLAVVLLAGLFVYWSLKHFHVKGGKEDIGSPKASERLRKLWQYVERGTKQGRTRATEKALLAILKIDHKNTAAYNRLGMIYARQSNYDDAIDCFSIASSLTPTLATLYNLGLVHYEKGNFKDAANAFERVVDLEPNVKRYIAYAKALNKLESYKKVTDILQKVVALEPTAHHYEMLAQALHKIKEYAKAEEAHKQLAIIQSQKITAPKPNRRQARVAARRS